MSFTITCISIPTIVRVSALKKLFDFPNERASHENSVPNLGGLAIFAGFLITIVIFTLDADAVVVRYITGALLILFFTGLKDDILIVDPKKKLVSQLLAAVFIVFLCDIRINSFHGIAGINDISYLLSVLVSMFLIMSLINGFNLIDGVDGLSAAIGILDSLLFGTWFFFSGQVSWCVISFSLTGSLSAYFLFNVFGKSNKIFMGDTGSMIIGLIVSLLAIKFVDSDKNVLSFVTFKSSPAFAFALLAVPLFDTLRIILMRLINGKSPFKADKNHIHHNLLKIGLNHLQVTILSASVTLALTLVVILLRNANSLLTISLIILIATTLTLFLETVIRKRKEGYHS